MAEEAERKKVAAEEYPKKQPLKHENELERRPPETGKRQTEKEIIPMQ